MVSQKPTASFAGKKNVYVMALLQERFTALSCRIDWACTTDKVIAGNNVYKKMNF
jgi:predicted metallopeptidase